MTYTEIFDEFIKLDYPDRISFMQKLLLHSDLERAEHEFNSNISIEPIEPTDT